MGAVTSKAPLFSLVFAGVLAVSPAFAYPITVAIPGLYSTGVANNGVALPDGAAELHYKFLTTDSVPTVSDGHGGILPSASLVVAVYTQPNPGTPTSWSGNAADSAWIGPSTQRLVNSPGRYYYSLQFYLPSAYDPSTVSMSAYIFADDVLANIRVNTTSYNVNNLTPGDPAASWTEPTLFNLATGFQTGWNVLEFRVDNDGHGGFNPTGFRAALTGTVVQVADLPEPVSMAVCLVGLAGVASLRRRRAKRPA